MIKHIAANLDHFSHLRKIHPLGLRISLALPSFAFGSHVWTRLKRVPLTILILRKSAFS